MSHTSITRVQWSAPDHWDEACASLQAVLALSGAAGIDEGEVVGSVRLVRLDATRGVLMLECPDAAGLARATAGLTLPWLERVTPWLAGAPCTEEGAVLLALDPGMDQGEALHAQIEGMDDAARLALFVRGVVADACVWGLYDETWARAPSPSGVEALPFWPARALAARCATGAWGSFAPRSIDLPAFVDQWLTGMDQDGIVAALLPTPTRAGAVVPAAVLARALAETV